jgi:hypothetical protein
VAVAGKVYQVSVEVAAKLGAIAPAEVPISATIGGILEFAPTARIACVGSRTGGKYDWMFASAMLCNCNS